jgi:preprotein translocase subunit SecD
MIDVLRCASAVLAVLAVVSCGTTVPPSPPPDTTELTVSIPIHTTDKAVIDAAVEVMSKRLRALGVGNFSSSAGTNLTFTVDLDGTVDRAAIDAVLRTPGVVSFVGWTTADPPRAGDPAPQGVRPLFDTAGQIMSASNDETADASTVVLTLAADGAAALATFTSNHVGDYLVIVLDGKVLESPVVMSAIRDGRLALSFPTGLALPPEALAAVMASGPLPAGWIAP